MDKRKTPLLQLHSGYILLSLHLSLPGGGIKYTFNSSLGDSNVGLWLKTVFYISASQPLTCIQVS